MTGKRIQVYKSAATKRQLKAEYAKVLNAISEHRFVARDGITVNGYLDWWEPAHGRDLEDGSRMQIRHALARVREFMGDRKLQSVNRADVDAMVDWLATKGRKRGGKPGTPLGARSIQLTLTHFQRACDAAIEGRLISINPVRRVKRPKQSRPVLELWSDEETALLRRLPRRIGSGRFCYCNAWA